jgi:hypothetical protein
MNIKKTLTPLYLLLILLPLGTFADSKLIVGSTTPEITSYNACRASALSRKENILSLLRKDYVKESNRITNETKIGVEIIKWRILSSFRIESKKILDEQRSKLAALSNNTNQLKMSAIATWKAEDALCIFNHEKSLKK